MTFSCVIDDVATGFCESLQCRKQDNLYGASCLLLGLALTKVNNRRSRSVGVVDIVGRRQI